MGSGLSIGIDLVEVDRFADAIRRWPRLVDRVFTGAELRDVGSGEDRDERLAARFAAKEATFKALGHGWPEVGYRDVEVRRRRGGAPWLSLDAKAAELAGARSSVVSLSHTERMAAAHVVLFREGREA